MLIAGLGFRESADVASLKDALTAAGGIEGVAALATAEAKSGAQALQSLAAEFGLPVIAVAPAALMAVVTLTRSDRVMELFGTGSLAEAAALVAGGHGARLLGPRAISCDGLATAALAVVGAAETEASSKPGEGAVI